MHRNASLTLSLLVMIVSGYGVFAASAWPWKAALFPLAIGIPLFCLAAAEALWSLLGSPAAGAEGKDFQLAIGPQTAHRSAIVTAWILGFFAAVLLLGFPIAVPLFVFLFLKLQGSEGWGVSIAMTLAVWGIFYGLFDKLLHLPFPAGLLVTWLSFG